MIRRTIWVLLVLTAVATLVLGVVTYERPLGDYFPSFACFLANGEVRFLHTTQVPWTASAVKRLDFAGVYFEREITANTKYTRLHVPLYVPLVLLSTCPVLAFIRGPVRRYRRRRKGLCVKCGYDLTGNVTGVCSECGEAI